MKIKKTVKLLSRETNNRINIPKEWIEFAGFEKGDLFELEFDTKTKKIVMVAVKGGNKQ